MPLNPHNAKSSYREAVLKHLFVGEVLRQLWLDDKPAEVMTPEVDDSGYDLVMESGAIIRHIQLKSSHTGSSTRQVPLNLRLGEKPSGCVVWMVFDPEKMCFEKLLWYGGEPGEPLPSMDGLKTAKHSRANAAGIKAERPAIRILPIRRFEVVDSVKELVARLFGSDLGSIRGS